MIEQLQRMYALVWREGDLETAFAGLPDDFEWVVPRHPDGGVLRGSGAVADFFRDWIDQWEEPATSWTLEQTGPETVLALATTTGRGRASGVPVEMHFAQVWTFHDGRPARMVMYTDLERARRAAEAGPAGERRPP
jgi:ketosteroid isomerase-like protein